MIVICCGRFERREEKNLIHPNLEDNRDNDSTTIKTYLLSLLSPFLLYFVKCQIIP